MTAHCKHFSRPFLFGALVISVANFPALSPAATSQFWNPGGTGGDGIWGTSPGDKNWNTVAGAPAGNTAWPDTTDDVAVFQDVIGGIVTVFDPVQAAGIVQNGADYTINASTITLDGGSPAITPFIEVNSGILTIDSVLAGTAGMAKTGAGTLVLSADNSYTGKTTVQQGTLELSGTLAGNSWRDSVSVKGGGLILSGNNLGDGTYLLIGRDGTVTMNGDDTVSQASIYGTTEGPGTLTAGKYTLAGATINGHLGEGQVEIRGGRTSTIINGTLGSDDILIIDNSATAVFSGDNIRETAEVRVARGSTMRLNGDVTGANLAITNASTLAGTGVFTALAGARLHSGAIVSGNLSADIGVSTSLTEPVLVSGSIGGGSLAINSGALLLTGTSTNPDILIAAGASLVDQGDLGDTAALANNGTLTVDSTDTIGTYIQNPGALLDGRGELTAANGATLNGGEVAGTLLGNITSTGTVTISGTVGGGDLTVTGGVLDLTGTAMNPLVNVRVGEMIVSGHNIADTSLLKIQSGGILTMNGDDTVDSTTISGTVNGAGTLTARTYSLRDGAVINGHLGEGSIYMTTRGTVTVNGTLASDGISIGGRTSMLILSGDNLEDTATVKTFRDGTLRMDGDDTVGTYTSSDATLSGPGTLTATSGATLKDRAIVSGNLSGNITVFIRGRGTVLVSGTIGGGSLTVNSGKLILTGTSTNTPVTIAYRATLDDQSGGLADTAAITNSGTLNVGSDDTIATYTSNGDTRRGSGTLTGPGILTATGGAALHDGSVVSGHLLADTTSDGMVLVSGMTGGGSLDVTGGILTITGHAANTPVSISPGASIVTRSPDAFSDTAALTNGGTLVLNGHEQVGSYHSLATGALQLDVTGPSVLDRLTAQTVTLDPGSALTLESTNLGLGEIADIIDGTVTGTFATITPLAGTGKDLRYSFNPNAGTIQALPGPALPGPGRMGKATLYNLTWNQTRTIGAAFDDTHVDPIPAPGQEPTGNFRKIHYRDTGNPDPALRWQEIPADQARYYDTLVYDLDPGLGRVPAAPGSQEALLGETVTQFQASYDIKRDKSGAPVLDATGAPITIVTGPGKAVANLISPEVHQGMADFTRQTMRDHVRAARNTAPVATAGKGQVFAAVHSSRGGTNASPNNAAYDVNPNGAVAGIRYQPTTCLRIGALLGATDGDIKGALVDTDGSGFVIGVFGEYFLGQGSRTNLFSSLTYGDFDYDASRRSFGGYTGANSVGSNAVEFALGIESILLERGPFRLVPRGALRYMNGTVDGFMESGRGVRMSVGELDIDSLLLDVGLDAEFRPAEYATITAHIGYLNDFKDSGNVVAGRYLAGGAPVGVYAPGIDEQAVVLGLGAWFDVNASFRFGLNWRSEFRNDSQDVHSIGVGGSWGF